MKRTALKIGVLSAILVIGLAGITMANGKLRGPDPAMMVSPSTIVLAKINTITVHTNIPASIVDSLDLDGVAPRIVYADSLGHVAAKFSVDALGLEAGPATLTLYVETALGNVVLTDTVRVK